jgi:mannose-6-phosphate isomerase-like protein (cupin superfamily)
MTVVKQLPKGTLRAEGQWIIPVVHFPKPESVGPRVWGQEILIDICSGYWTLKLIKMNSGAEGGFQYHHLKDEGAFMLKGEMRLLYNDSSGNLVERLIGPGTYVRIPPGAHHKAIAIGDVEYFEVSTPHFNDRVHVEAVYGIPDEAGGLPSTAVEDVECR